MSIFVASTSEHKLNPVRSGLVGMESDEPLVVIGKKAKSGINEQPEGAEETLQGVLNRLADLKAQLADTRYKLLVAFENGLLPVQVGNKKRWFDPGWVVVEDEHGHQAFAHSAGIEFDESAVAEAREKGFDTTTVGSIVAAREQADSGDPQRTLTNGLVARSAMLEQAFKIALGQLLHATKRNSL